MSSWWRFGWDITVESDDSFRRFYKLDPILQTDRVNTVYLQGMSERNYFSARLYQFGGLLLDRHRPTRSPASHPVIDYRYIVGHTGARRRAQLQRHARNMTRDDGTDTTHALAEANWRRKMIDPIGQVWTPFCYRARRRLQLAQDAATPTRSRPFPNDTVARGVAAAGMLYSYPFVAHTGGGSHVIEPTAQIIARQNKSDQRRLPDEDAKSLVFDDTLLFDVDKFSGYDRFETGTRANVGVQYTFQANNGVYARAVLGQSIQVAGDNAYVDPGLRSDPTG